ncbi:MAG: AAA-associated domain-containing protein [Atribacterota bacterium]
MDDETGPYLKAGVSEVIGFLEILDDESGKIDVYRLGKNIDHQLEQLLSVLETARLLGFIEYDAGDVFFTPKGKHFVQSSQEERKKIIATTLLEIPVFKELLSFLTQSEEHTVGMEYLDQLITRDFTTEEVQKIKNAMLHWGRFAELIWVDSDQQEIHLEEKEEEA